MVLFFFLLRLLARITLGLLVCLECSVTAKKNKERELVKRIGKSRIVDRAFS